MILTRIKSSQLLIPNGMFNFILLYFVFNLKNKGKKEDDKIEERVVVCDPQLLTNPKLITASMVSSRELSLGFQPSTLRAILTITQTERSFPYKKNTELTWENICELPAATC